MHFVNIFQKKKQDTEHLVFASGYKYKRLDYECKSYFLPHHYLF